MARDFDGADDHITCGDVSVANFATTDSYTWTLWVRHDSLTDYQAYLTKMHGTGPTYIIRKNTGGPIEWEGGQSGNYQTFQSVTHPSVSTWYFVAIVRDVGADQWRMYLATASGDVTLDNSATDTTTGAHGSAGTNLDIAQQSNGFRMNGRMADIRLYRRVLTLNELRMVKQGGHPGRLDGHWPLWGVASPEPDLSGNSNNGTVTGAVRSDHAPVGTYAPFVVGESALVAAVETVTVSPTGISAAEDWGEANYADERFTYADSALDYEGHAALIDVVLQVQPAGIASAEAFGTAEVVSGGVATIAPDGIGSGEAFGTPAVSFVVQPTAIASEEAVGTASVGLVVVPSAIPSEEAVGAPALVVQIQPAGIASAEAFGTALVGLAIAPTGIVSDEAVGTPSVRFVVAPSAIPTGQAFGTPAVSGPGTISTESIVSAEAVGTPSLVAVIVPTGIVSSEAVGTPTVSLVQFLVFAIPSEEAFGTARVVWVVQPTGVPSGEAFGTAQVVLLGPGQPGRMARLSGTHSPREGLSGTHSPREGLEGTHGPREALVGNSGLE